MTTTQQKRTSPQGDIDLHHMAHAIIEAYRTDSPRRLPLSYLIDAAATLHMLTQYPGEPIPESLANRVQRVWAVTQQMSRPGRD